MNYSGKVCLYCGGIISNGDHITICPQCEQVYHMGCWEKNNGCATPGCIARGNEVKNKPSASAGKQMSARNASAPAQRPAPRPAQRPIPRPVQPPVQYQAPRPVQRVDKKPSYHDPAPGYGRMFDDSFDRGNKTENTAIPHGFMGGVNRTSPVSYASGAQHMSSPIGDGSMYDADGKMNDKMQTIVQSNLYYYDLRFQKMSINQSKISWNWAAAFFNVYWMLYRKMYKNTIIIMGISIVLGGILGYLLTLLPLLSFVVYPILSIANFVLFGLYGNYVYMKHVEKKYTEGLPLEPGVQRQFYSQKGGTSVLAVILGHLAISAVLSIIFWTMTAVGVLSSFGSLIGF